MASLTLTGGENEMTWQITGLSSAFNTSNYKGAAIASSYQGDGIDSLSYFAYSTAPASRTAKYTPEYSRWMSAGTYTFYGYARAANGLYYYCGADSCVVTEPEPEPTIPTFDVDTVTPYGFDINVYDTTDYPWVRYAVYVGDTSTNVLDVWVNTGGSFNYKRVTGLQPSTRYRINVYYATSRYAYDGDWIGVQYHYTNAEPTYTYLYRARLYVDDSLYDWENGSVTTTSSSGYNFSVQEVKDMLTIPSGLTYSSAAAGNSYCTFSNGYFTLLSTAQSNRAYMNLYYETTTYTLTIYHYYNGSTHSTEQDTITSGTRVYPADYADPPSGYEYDHAESPWGTTVSSFTMSGNKSVFLIYEAITPTTPTASISVTGRTASSLTVSATLTTSLTRSDAWYLCISDDSSFSTYQTIRGSGSSASGTFSGLSAHTTYYFKVVNVYNQQYAWQSSYTTGTTKYANFVWDNGNNLDNRRPTVNEWTRLVSFVETVCSTTIPQSVKNTIYASGTLTASLFNALSSATGLSTVVSTGTRIYKSVLNALRDKANEHT